MRWILLPFFACFLISAFAQENPAKASPIPLNKHYFEIAPEDSANHVYNKLISYTPDSVKIERFFTLENKMIRIYRTNPKAEEYQEATYEYFDLSGNLVQKTVANLYNSKFLTTYFSAGQQIAQIMYRGEHKYRIQRGEAEPQERLDNDFEPRPNEEKSDFGFFISQRTRIPSYDWPSEGLLIHIGILVDDTGVAKEIVWANPWGGNEKLAGVFVKAIKAWKKGYLPARDIQGNPIEKWLYLHYHVGGRINATKTVIEFQR